MDSDKSDSLLQSAEDNENQLSDDAVSTSETPVAMPAAQSNRGLTHLLVKIKFIPLRRTGNAGLIFFCVEKGRDSFLILRTLVHIDTEWIENISISESAFDFYSIIKNFLNSVRSASSLYDAQVLKNGFLDKVSPSIFQGLFELGNSQVYTSNDENSPAAGKSQAVTLALTTIINAILPEIFVEKLNFEFDYEFADEPTFDDMREKFELNPRFSPSKFDRKLDPERFKLYLKGQFVIDPVSGVAASNLEPGNEIYVEITDRSDVALAAAKMVGAFKSGLWLPIRGLIVEVHDLIGDRRRFRLRLSPGIYLDVLSFSSILVRNNDLSLTERLERAEELNPLAGTLPLLVSVLLVAVFILAILVLR
ncbi:MAG: hypothetical protein ABIC40_01795 [bacterium]